MKVLAYASPAVHQLLCLMHCYFPTTLLLCYLQVLLRCRICFDIAIVVHVVLLCCQVEVVVAENEKLQTSLAKAKEASSAATAKADAAQGADAGTALLREENDLLRQASMLGGVQDAVGHNLVQSQCFRARSPVIHHMLQARFTYHILGRPTTCMHKSVGCD